MTEVNLSTSRRRQESPCLFTQDDEQRRKKAEDDALYEEWLQRGREKERAEKERAKRGREEDDWYEWQYYDPPWMQGKGKGKGKGKGDGGNAVWRKLDSLQQTVTTLQSNLATAQNNIQIVQQSLGNMQVMLMDYFRQQAAVCFVLGWCPPPFPLPGPVPCGLGAPDCSTSKCGNYFPRPSGKNTSGSNGSHGTNWTNSGSRSWTFA